MIVKPVLLWDVSIRRHFCMKLEKVDKGDGKNKISVFLQLQVNIIYGKLRQCTEKQFSLF